MPIFKIKDKTLLFLHIPKAGGSSMEEWLLKHGSMSFHMEHNTQSLPCVPQHFHGALIENLFAPEYFDYSFAITRNPYKRLLSEYNYRMNLRPLRKRLLPAPSFSSWVRKVFKVYEQRPFVYGNHIRPQVEYLIKGTETFKLEGEVPSLLERISDICAISMDDKLGTSNKSVVRASKIDEATATLIYEFYKSDFETFSYTRDSY